jgi:hypothetical protein
VIHEAKRPALLDHPRMPPGPGEIRLILCIDLDADPITGSLISEDGAQRRFSGWMALSATLQTMRGELAQQQRNPDAGPAQAR